MRKQVQPTLVLFVALLALGALYLMLQKKAENISASQGQTQTSNHYEESGTGTYIKNGVTFQNVRNADLGISFAYRISPNGYVLSEPATTEAQVVRIYTLMNAKDAADLAASKGVPREGPPVIMVKIYDNPARLSAGAWIAAHQREVNVTANTTLTDTMAGGAKAVSFTGDGLYQSSNIVADNNGKIYFILGEYDAPTDQIAKDFQALLSTLVLF
jgi:hypothetical protein